MNPPKIIRGCEHEPIVDPIPKECLERLNRHDIDRKKSETLGLHGKSGGFAPGNYIGMVWLGEGDNRVVLRVDSKFSTMDYIAMYMECMADPLTSDQTAKCLYVWSDEKPIETNGHDFSILIIIAYLRELNKFCQRHMRRHFMRERQNFVGKMRGKILPNENLRRNIIHARLDRIYCEYQSVSDDILENQILRTALERASHFFNEYRGDKDVLDALPQWIRASRAVLNGVSTKKVKPSDFTAARKHGAFAPYKHPLALAKLILQKLGPNPHEKNSQTYTPPYAFNSWKLFECYAEIKLSNKFKALKRGIKKDFLNAEDYMEIEPDFYIKNMDKQKPRIIDAKYKDIHDSYFTGTKTVHVDKKKKPSRHDVYQVVAYSQHRGLLDEMKCKDKNSVELGLAYPYIGESDDPVINKEPICVFMSPLTIYGIPCPAKKTTKTTSADDN